VHVKLKHQELLEQWRDYYDKIINEEMNPLTLRSVGLSLAMKCTHFARMVCGSEAVLAPHPLNRINREIWQYAIAGYSLDQLEVYLDNIG
jgi:hypothetical protein